MAHSRQLIREAVKAQLVGETVAETRVYETRIAPHKRAELPAIAIYTLDESVTEFQSSPRQMRREVRLVVEGAVSGAANIDDALDDLALEVEVALHADETFGGAASDALLTSTESEVREESGEIIGVVQLIYTVVYFTYAPDAVGGLDDFETADVRQSGEQATADQAHDTVTIPQEE